MYILECIFVGEVWFSLKCFAVFLCHEWCNKVAVGQSKIQ